ncbi:MAG: hypothetical protein ACU0A5_07750 [Salipiger marinus]|uniref:hypothetical protein n=1 Tax=Salipiger marinus TaxID=555512 RepID=UPI00405A3358
MPDAGARTTDLATLATVDDLLGHRDGAVGRVLIDTLAIRLAASGALADLLASKLSSEDLAGLEAAVTALEAVAQEANPVYPDEATGRAAVGDGVQFRVAPASADESYRVYERVDAATISTLVTVVPSVADFTEKVSQTDLAGMIQTGDLPDGWHLIFTNSGRSHFTGGIQDAPGGGVRWVFFDLLIPASARIEGAEGATLADRLLPVGPSVASAAPETDTAFGVLSQDGQRWKFWVPTDDRPIMARVTAAVEAEGVVPGGVDMAALAPEVAERLTAPRYVAELAGAGLWACNLQTGERVSIAGVGASDPEIVGDAIVYTLDGAQVWRPTDGSRPAARLASRLDGIVHYGDSLTAAADGVGSLGTVLGVTSINRGVGGWSVADIATRAGAIQPLVTLTGGELPASGSVAVTAIEPATGWSPYVDTTFFGTILGEPVTMVWDHTAETHTITRDVDGSAIPVPPGTPFISSENATYREYCQTIWVGRNAVTSETFEEDTLAMVAALVAHLTPLARRFVVIGVTNATSETRGTTAYDKIVSLNERLAEIYGPYFYDLRRDFINYGLARAGIPPTDGDTENIEADAPPPSLMADPTHPTSPTGYNVQRDLVAEWLQAKGWF